MLKRLSKLIKFEKNGQHFIVMSELIKSETSLTSYSIGCDLSEEQKEIAHAKADLLRLWMEKRKNAPWGKKQLVCDQFLIAFETGIPFPELSKKIGKVDSKTIEGWRNKMNENGGDPLCLADLRGHVKRNSCIVSEEEAEILIKIALSPNRPKISEVIRIARAVMKTRNIPTHAKDRTIYDFLNKWKSKHYDIWVFHRQGASVWNDKCAYYIERDYSLLDVGDVLVADGHKLNYKILHPFIGKPTRMILIVWYDMKANFPLGWSIVPTENIQAIHLALRRAILRLGKFPKVVYLDNGRAFRAKFYNSVNFEESGISGLYTRLGIKTIFAWPYHGQSKTVERFFGIFAELERLMPTYIGTEIDRQPPRLKRGEKLHRAVYKKKMQGRGITIEMAHRIIAAWFDEYAQRPQRGHLEGRTPFEVFAEGRGPGIDPKDLRELLMSYEIKRIGRNGVRFQGKHFYDDALYGRRHPVVIKYDLQDLNSILVYEKSGEFICEAFQTPKVHPAATALGNDEDRTLLKEQIELKRRQQKESSIFARDFLENHVLPEHFQYLENNGLRLAAPFKREETPEIPIQTEEELAAQIAQIENFKEMSNPIFSLDSDRYTWILGQISKGIEISEENLMFMENYEAEMDEFRKKYWQEYKECIGL